jgi:hypothetical protein
MTEKARQGRRPSPNGEFNLIIPCIAESGPQGSSLRFRVRVNRQKGHRWAKIT